MTTPNQALLDTLDRLDDAARGYMGNMKVFIERLVLSAKTEEEFDGVRQILAKLLVYLDEMQRSRLYFNRLAADIHDSIDDVCAPDLLRKHSPIAHPVGPFGALNVTPRNLQ